MVIGIKDMAKLFAISIVACCAVFVCTLFLNFNIDIVGIKDEISTAQGTIIYDAQVSGGKLTAAVSGGCLAITSVILLLFYVKNYIDTHGKELGILKALGYSRLKIAKHFWVFGLSILVGCAIGCVGAFLYMPNFYELQNADKLLPDIAVRLNLIIPICLVAVPSLLFCALSVLYAYFKMRRPPLDLLKEVQKTKIKISKKETKADCFLKDLRKSTLKSEKILVFFVAFSAFCFSAMTQMSMSMKALSSETFAWMIISIGLILAFLTLLLSLTSVIKANTKTIAMMKVFGYSRSECGKSLLLCYRPVSYVGFAIGTAYQYILLKLMVNVVFADFENMPTYSFDFKAFFITLIVFIAAYELIMYIFALRASKISIKSVMLE